MAEEAGMGGALVYAGLTGLSTASGGELLAAATLRLVCEPRERHKSDEKEGLRK